MTPAVGEKRNYDNIFYRNLLLATMRQFRNQLTWKNSFSDGDRVVTVPVTYSFSGDPRFAYDAFAPEVPTGIELDVPNVPSLVFTENGVTFEVSEQTNPNVYAQMLVEDGDDLSKRRMYSTLKALPVTVSYKLSAYVDTEIDLWKYREQFALAFYRYKYFTFEYSGMKIEAMFLSPEQFDMPVNREYDMQKNNRIISIESEIQVKTYFPIFDTPRPDNRKLSDRHKDHHVGAAGDVRSVGGCEPVTPAPWARSNLIAADSRVINWLYTIVEGASAETVADGSVPDLSEEAYTNLRAILQGSVPDVNFDPTPDDEMPIDDLDPE